MMYQRYNNRTIIMFLHYRKYNINNITQYNIKVVNLMPSTFDDMLLVLRVIMYREKGS